MLTAADDSVDPNDVVIEVTALTGGTLDMIEAFGGAIYDEENHLYITLHGRSLGWFCK